MDSRQALAVAVFCILGVALVLEASGFIEHEPATTAAAAGAEGSGELRLKEYDGGALRNAVMGAFLLACVVAFMRFRGDAY